MGLPIYDAVEPVIANTQNMTTICQLCSISQRAFSFSKFAILRKNIKTDLNSWKKWS